MKAVCLVVIGLAAMAAATPTTTELDTKLLTLGLKDKQVLLLKLLNHVLQPCMYKEIEELAFDFKFEDHLDSFTKTDVVKHFLGLLKTGLLPRGEIFSLHMNRQMEEVVTSFHLLYYAKDFATFLKVACWLRLYLNEGMFVYALTVAVRHREDCKGLVLPAPYEIYPYYFVRADVIQRAYLLKMKRGLLDAKLCDLYGIKETTKGVFVLDENVYDTRVYLNDDDRLRYFTEDIDLNTYFYYFHVDYPFWMKDTVFDKLKFRRGELNLYMYQQLLARHYLERLSNGLGEVQTLSFLKPIKNGVFPWLQLHNGVQLPVRYNNFVLVRDHDDNLEFLRMVNDVEAILKEAIIKGYIEIRGMRLELTKAEHVENLGRLLFGQQNHLDSEMHLDKTHFFAYRYLLVLLKSVLGFNTLINDKYFLQPTLLDSYQTALRDPVFYQLQKRLCDLLILFKLRLPSYTREELLFPGVKINNVLVDKLVTYFDDYLMDMTNAVMLTDEELKKTHSDMTFLVRKKRLNHEKFTVTLDLDSDKAADCVVRLYLGPKRDHLNRLFDLNRNRLNFVELDSFLYKLQTGKNTIVRHSYDMHNLVRDRVMTRDLWKKFDSLTDVKDLLFTELSTYNTGFPSRLLLPKGHVDGLELLLYVVVTPLRLVDGVDRDLFVNTDSVNTERLVHRSTVLLDKTPLGFPLDRYIDLTYFFVPNMKFVDVKVFHKRTTCDMRTRFERYVLRNYFLDRTVLDGDLNLDLDLERDNHTFHH